MRGNYQYYKAETNYRHGLDGSRPRAGVLGPSRLGAVTQEWVSRISKAVALRTGPAPSQGSQNNLIEWIFGL